jgi:DNA-binding CsgD family transcriptional regulator
MMAAPRAAPVLLGRASERQLLDQLLENVRGGRSAVLVIRGEAGIGKTALLHYCARQASGFRVARTAGVESEMELAFAGLHQLCAPMLGRLEALPLPQRAALGGALGLSDGAAPDRFLVGLAALSLLSEVASERPLLCFVDDVQWLDAASAQVLGFVARRLLAESVGIVFAVRDPSDENDLAGLPELPLAGLENEDARALLATVIPGRLDERVRDRLITETRGNPLALLELPSGLAATQLPGAFDLMRPQALEGQIEQRFLQRLEAIPEQAGQLLLLAAAEPLGDPALVYRAADQLGIDTSAAAAETDGLLAIGERVTFRHPLVRSAVYRSASPQDRRAVHAALAEATDAEIDADRRAWHLAASAPGRDEDVASELERSAGRAQARGGLAAAAAFLQRAVELTEDPALRAERALAAAEASFHAGAFDAALQLAAMAEASPLDGFQRARADLLRGHAAFASSYGNDAAPLLVQAARQLEQFDLELARKAYLTAWGAAITAGHLGGAGVLLEICHAIRALPSPAGTPHPLDLLLDGLAVLTTEGRTAATPILQRAAKAVVQMPVEDVLRWGLQAATASTAIWDSDGSHAILERQAQIVRDAGALAELPIHLGALAFDKAWRGDLAGAEALVAESDSVAAATGSHMPPFAALRLLALQGREAEASALIVTTIKQAEAAGQGETAKMAHWAAAVLYNGLARYDEALSAGREVTTNAIGPSTSMWALPELVEAAARVGDIECARDALDRLAQTTQPAGTEFALGIEARSRALLSDSTAADDLYREAIERLGRTQLRPELARAHLLYGEWLRREGRRLEAREQLRTAHDKLTAIGMEAFTERARRELIATGEKVRKRTPATRDELTPQEAQIAGMARDGLTNGEIGARLFLSPRTVEWHLHNVFAKLGIDSRRTLSDALPQRETEPTPA